MGKEVKMEKEVLFLRSEDTLTVILPKEIDHHAAKPIREKTDTEIFLNSPKFLVIDFSGVSFMDSSGIGFILGRCELCEDFGCKVRLKGVSGALMKIIRLSGIEKIKNLSVSDV